MHQALLFVKKTYDVLPRSLETMENVSAFAHDFFLTNYQKDWKLKVFVVFVTFFDLVDYILHNQTI
jgi:hypothetical protein